MGQPTQDDIMRDLIGAWEVGIEGSPLDQDHALSISPPSEHEPFARYFQVDGVPYRVKVEAL